MKKIFIIAALCSFLFAVTACGTEKCTVTTTTTSGSTTSTTTICGDSDCNVVTTVDGVTTKTKIDGCTFDSDSCSGTLESGTCE